MPGSLVLIMTAASCTMGALISGFAFEVNGTFLFFMWLIAAIMLSVSTGFLRGKGVLIAVPLILVIVIARLAEIVEGAQWVIFYITTEFNKWLYIPVFFPDAEPSAYGLTLFFAAAGVILAFLLSFAVCLKRSALLAVILTAPIVCLTFVLVNTIPNIWFLVGLLAVYLTLLINRTMDTTKKGQTIFTSLFLALLLLGTAYIVASPTNHRRDERINALDNVIRDIAARTGIARVKSGIGWPALSEGGMWRFDTEGVEIADAGQRNIIDHEILEVTATSPGTFYLRGYSMQGFDGRVWNVNSERLFPFEDAVARAMPALLLASFGRSFPDLAPENVRVTIDSTNDMSRNVIYTPYYSIPFRNVEEIYSFSFHHTEESVLDYAGVIPRENLPVIDLAEYNILVRDIYTQVEDSTSSVLRRLAIEAGIDPDADRAVIADAVAEYIIAAGRYTLSPYVIPEGEDFVLYFLQTSKQGYCIHFTTAATLMLRTLGVPARFTSGFVITVLPRFTGQSLLVTDRHAHAWVEVYYDDIGWLPLEVTPPAFGSGIPDGRPHAGAGTFYPALGGSFDDDMPPDWIMDYLREGEHESLLVPGSGAGGIQGQAAATGTGTWIVVIVCIAMLSATVLLHRDLAQKRRDRRFCQEDTNSAVIYAWRYVSKLDRLGRRWRRQVVDTAPSPVGFVFKMLPNEVEELAFKARFSQHRISGDERADMIDYAIKFAEYMYKRKSPLARFWMKWGMGV
jgi:hypothetical protein